MSLLLNEHLTRRYAVLAERGELMAWFKRSTRLARYGKKRRYLYALGMM